MIEIGDVMMEAKKQIRGGRKKFSCCDKFISDSLDCCKRFLTPQDLRRHRSEINQAGKQRSEQSDCMSVDELGSYDSS